MRRKNLYGFYTKFTKIYEIFLKGLENGKKITPIVCAI